MPLSAEKDVVDMIVSSVFIGYLASNKDRHKYSDELDFWPNRSIHF